jgi:hypothetical protein
MMRRFVLVCAVGALASHGAAAYPGGTPNYQTDAAPFCAGCHSSREAAALAGAGERAEKEVAERKHIAVILSGQMGYGKLSESDRRTLVDQVRALDEASSVTLKAPAVVKAGEVFQVQVRVTGGAGPVVGVGLVDRPHRWYARPVASAGFAVSAPPEITGSDGKPRTKWLERRPARLQPARAGSPRHLSPGRQLLVRHGEIHRARLHHQRDGVEGAPRRPRGRLGSRDVHAPPADPGPVASPTSAIPSS